MKKALIFLLLLSVLFIGLLVIFEQSGQREDEKPFIAVTNFALYDIATHVLSTQVEVKKLIPFGVEAHSYVPSVKTMSELSKAEFFVFIGLGMEPWIGKEQTKGLDVSRFAKLKEEACSHDEAHGHHEHGAVDPHYWLSIENMIRMTMGFTIRAAEQFPEHKAAFISNAEAYIEKLIELDAQYKERLVNCKHREIVVNHNAFSYLGESYDFASHSVTGLSPDEQASAKKMREITDLVKNEGIGVIFFESFVSPKVSETIAQETGAKVDALQPLANVTEDEAKKGYIALMRDNLQKLAAAMECE
jgi:zinc transport system substrate-binding protein